MIQPVFVVVAHQLLLDPEHGVHYSPEIAALPDDERLVAMARFDAESTELLETIAETNDVLLVSLVEPVLTEDGEEPSEAEVAAAKEAIGYLDIATDSDLEDVVWDALRAARRVRIELLTQQAAALQRVRELARKWQEATETGSDRPSIVAKAFADTLQQALDGSS